MRVIVQTMRGFRMIEDMLDKEDGLGQLGSVESCYMRLYCEGTGDYLNTPIKNKLIPMIGKIAFIPEI